LGLLVTAGLVRFGPSFENIAWASLFFIAPIGCIYYPVEILPNWLQPIALALPLAHIFEETRSILITNTVHYSNIYYALMLNMIYLFLAICTFYYSFKTAKIKGSLINVGE
jgi:ABC-2 type transport system permease protein